MTASWTPSEEEVELAAEALFRSDWSAGNVVGPAVKSRYEDAARAVLATVGLLVERERKAAAVEALREAAAAFRPEKRSDITSRDRNHATVWLEVRADEIEALS